MVGAVSFKSLCRTILINVAVFAILILLLDMGLALSRFEKQPRSYGKDELTCASELTGYDYCKSIEQVYYLDKRDRIFPVYNYIDLHGRSTYRTPDLIPPVRQSRKIYLLGDSFIQADELWIEERFEHLLRIAGFDVEAHGYSSWNSWQYRRIGDALSPKAGEEIFIFSMSNDYTPHYGNSTIQSLTKFEQVRDEATPEVDGGFWRAYSRQSFFLNRIYFDLKNLFDHQFSANPTNNAGSKGHRPTKGCPTQDSRLAVASDLAEDYLMLDGPSDCWSQRMTESVDLNIAMLNQLKSKLEERGAVVHILLVPAGWAFPDQNTVGRMASDYEFPVGSVVSHHGLVNYLQSHGLKIDDLTGPLSKGNRGENSLYYAVDGHWTPHAHAVIFDHLMNTYLRGQ